MEELTLQDVKNILRIEVRKSLKHIHWVEYGTNKWDKDKLNESLSKVEMGELKLKKNLKKDYKEVVDKIEKEIDKILISQNLNPNRKNIEYQSLKRRWIELKLMRQEWKKELLWENNKTDDDFRREIDENWKMGLFDNGKVIEEGKSQIETKQPQVIQEPTKPQIITTPLLSKVYPEHLEEMKRRRRREGTIDEAEGTYKELIEILGDKAIGDYTYEDSKEYRLTLTKLPKNRKRVKKYKSNTLEKLLSMNIPKKELITNETQNKLLSRVSTLWNYLIDEYPQYKLENVFKKKQRWSSQRKQKDKRDDFLESDLQLIFDPKHYLTEIFDNPKLRRMRFPYYFIPIFSLLSGCRIEEVSQMRTRDIVRVGNIWVYRLRESGEYMEEETKVKNVYSERDIPIHNVLVNILGFVRYVKKMESSGYERVFHELPKVRNKYSKNISRWFNGRYLEKLGLRNGDRILSFHSFRHSVETKLVNENVNIRHIDYLMGHSQKGVGGKIYLKRVDVAVLMENCVKKLGWDIDWKNLKINWKK